MSSISKSNLNDIGYREWQALIRLPSLILLNFYFDSAQELFVRQLSQSIEHLHSTIQQTRDITLSHLFCDALEELPGNFNDHLEHHLYPDTANYAVSVEIARKTLSATQFQIYCQTMYQIIEKACTITSRRTKLARYLRPNYETAAAKNIDAVKAYFRELTNQG